MYLVIAIHTTPPLPTPSLLSIFSYGFFALTKISVPLFVMVSGALLIPKEESYRTFFTKRVIHVLIPWIFWTILSVLWQVSSGQLSPNSFHDWISLVHVTFFTQYWFIPMLFTLYLLTPLFHLFAVNAKKGDLLYIVIIWFLAVSLVPSITALTGIHIFNTANIFLQYSGYYLLGYMLRGLKYEKQAVRNIFILFIISIAALVLMQWIAITTRMPADTWVLGFISPLSIGATISFFCLCIMLDGHYGKKIPPPVTKWIFSIGSATLGIYFYSYFSYANDVVISPSILNTTALSPRNTVSIDTNFLSLIFLCVDPSKNTCLSVSCSLNHLTGVFCK